MGINNPSPHSRLTSLVRSGLQCLRAVLSCGMRAIVLERKSTVGGVWNQAYEGLHVQGACLGRDAKQPRLIPVSGLSMLAYLHEHPNRGHLGTFQHPTASPDLLLAVTREFYQLAGLPAPDYLEEWPAGPSLLRCVCVLLYACVGGCPVCVCMHTGTHR